MMNNEFLLWSQYFKDAKYAPAFGYMFSRKHHFRTTNEPFRWQAIDKNLRVLNAYEEGKAFKWRYKNEDTIPTDYGNMHWYQEKAAHVNMIRIWHSEWFNFMDAWLMNNGYVRNRIALRNNKYNFVYESDLTPYVFILIGCDYIDSYFPVIVDKDIYHIMDLSQMYISIEGSANYPTPVITVTKDGKLYNLLKKYGVDADKLNTQKVHRLIGFYNQAEPFKDFDNKKKHVDHIYHSRNIMLKSALRICNAKENNWNKKFNGATVNEELKQFMVDIPSCADMMKTLNLAKQFNLCGDFDDKTGVYRLYSPQYRTTQELYFELNRWQTASCGEFKFEPINDCYEDFRHTVLAIMHYFGIIDDLFYVRAKREILKTTGQKDIIKYYGLKYFMEVTEHPIILPPFYKQMVSA